MSFAMVDEYENSEMGSVQYIYTNLLIACAQDKEAGLKMAIEVRKFYLSNISIICFPRL